MEYEGVICHPPMELGAFLLPVAVGCTHNQCTFCAFYKDKSFRIIPLEEVDAELTRASETGRAPRRIFLGDGNPFVLPADRLLTVLDVIRRHFPEMPPVHMDATVANVAGKSDEELRALRLAGVQKLYIGLECGDESALSKLQKGFTELRNKSRWTSNSIHLLSRLLLYRMAADAYATLIRQMQRSPEKRCIVSNSAIFAKRKDTLSRVLSFGLRPGAAGSCSVLVLNGGSESRLNQFYASLRIDARLRANTRIFKWAGVPFGDPGNDPNPRPVGPYPVGDGFGSVFWFEPYEATHFRNRVVKRATSKPRGPKKKKM